MVFVVFVARVRPKREAKEGLGLAARWRGDEAMLNRRDGRARTKLKGTPSLI